MGKLNCEIDIEAPCETVFERATSFATMPEYISGVTEVEMLTEGPLAVGTRFREKRVIFGKEAVEELEVTAVEPGQMVELGCDSCGVRYRSRYTFEQGARGQTKVSLHMESTPLSAGARFMGMVMSPLMKGTMRKLLENDMADLKRACEQQAGGDAEGTPGA